LLSFFVAVLLDQSNNGIELKREQFKNWFESLPKEKINEKGEIKGSDLTDEELFLFVKSVYNADPIIRQEIVSMHPKENPEELMKQFKKIEVENLTKVSELAKLEGKHEMAKQYERMAIWHKNAKKMHYPHFFKLILLRDIISKSFNVAVGVSILLEMLGDKDSVNLLNIKFKIDQDFVRGNDPTIYWKELLRNHFISNSLKNPIPALDTWKQTGHPFLEKYKGKDDDTYNVRDIIKNNCDFLESHENFEIQIADITGIIINRFFNRNKAIDAYNEMYRLIKKQKMTRLILNREPNFDTNPIIME
jgi:hypothetical protein